MDNRENLSSSENPTPSSTQSTVGLPSSPPASAPIPSSTISSSSQPDSAQLPAVNPLESQPVVIPVSQEELPKWFYILFLLVVIVFIFITALLILNFREKTKPDKNLSPLGSVTLTPYPTQKSVEPTQLPEATDSALLKLGTLTDSDEVSDIEKDLEESSLTFIDEDLQALDQDAGVTSQ